VEIDGETIIRWKSPDLYSDITSPVIVDGYVYGCYGGPFSISPYASLRCLELKTGKLMWEEGFFKGTKFVLAYVGERKADYFK
jgi:hypothetical protein